jgi:hypothetical protein
MRLGQLFAAVATASLWTDAIAVPLEARGSKALSKRGGSPINKRENKPDPSKNKYFHEPG